MEEVSLELVKLLTAREKQVFKLIGQGYTNPKIAIALFITIRTVKAHVSNIFAKLQVDNRSKVAVIAAKYYNMELNDGDAACLEE